MEVLYLFEKARIKIDLIQTETLLKSRNYKFEPLSFGISDKLIITWVERFSVYGSRLKSPKGFISKG